LHWRSRLNLAISDNNKTGLYAHKSNKIIEIDQCLIAVKKINNSKVFKEIWKNKDKLSLSVSSENEINISQKGKTIYGSNELNEVVENLNYKISPNSFWQSHIKAPSLILKQINKYAKINFGDIVCDLYGGSGLFTYQISKLIGNNGKVHLIERDNACIKNAKKMFQNTKNIVIHHGKVEQKIEKIKKINTIILDPPRSGASKKVINQIIKKKPNSIIYISCNPASLARDSKILTENNYKLNNLVGLDLFPMTQHIECVASFSK